MKLLSKFSFLALALAIGFTSCKKDKDDDGGSNAPNEMNIKGSKSTIQSGMMTDYGSVGAGLYNFDLTLLGSGITLHTAQDSLSGSGDALYFEMFTSDSTGLDAGSYSFNQNVTDKTFDIGSAYVNFSFSTEQFDDLVQATDGTVTIDKDGNTYIIDVEFTDGNANNVTAHYEGTLFKN